MYLNISLRNPLTTSLDPLLCRLEVVLCHSAKQPKQPTSASISTPAVSSSSNCSSYASYSSPFHSSVNWDTTARRAPNVVREHYSTLSAFRSVSSLWVTIAAKNFGLRTYFLFSIASSSALLNSPPPKAQKWTYTSTTTNFSFMSSMQHRCSLHYSSWTYGTQGRFCRRTWRGVIIEFLLMRELPCSHLLLSPIFRHTGPSHIMGLAMRERSHEHSRCGNKI